MDWTRQFRNWKFVAVLAFILLICETGPHVEISVPDFVPSTTVSIQVSGGYQVNVNAQTFIGGNHP